MSIPKRERILLAVLGVVVVLGVMMFGGEGNGGDVAELSDTERAKIRAQRARAAARTRGGDGGSTDEVVTLDLAALEPLSASFEVGRSPFRYAPEPKPPPEPKPRPEPTPRPDPEPRVEPEPTGPRPPSTSHLRYLGRFGHEGRPIAVLVSGGELHNVKEGEVLEGTFVVEDIGYESVAIGFVEFPDAAPRRLPVGGSE